MKTKVVNTYLYTLKYVKIIIHTFEEISGQHVIFNFFLLQRLFNMYILIILSGIRLALVPSIYRYY